MRLRLRTRLFVWLIMLLVAFVVVQAAIYAAIEYVTWLADREEPLRQEMMEVVSSVFLDVLMLPILIGFAWWISARMVRPIKSIAATAQRIEGGEVQERIQTAEMPDDEMTHLAQSINAAFDHYNDAVEHLKRFASDASHQLRTPLAVVQNIGEVTLSRERGSDEYRAALADILEEARRLSGIVEQLLKLARLGSSEITNAFVDLDVRDVVADAVETYRALCEEKRIRLQLELGDGASVRGNPPLLRELVANLLDNALKHTPNDGRIRLTLARRSGLAELVVADSGPGVDPRLERYLFERFAAQPGFSEAGAGLGLAIVADIARLHGGRVELVKGAGPGAVFRVTLPLAAEA